MPITYQEKEQYLLGLSEEELGELVSKRLQPAFESAAEADQFVGKGRKGRDNETIFASVYHYNPHHPYASKLRNVVDILMDDWTDHDPQIIDRNPKPLADLIYLARRIDYDAKGVDKIVSNSRFDKTLLPWGRESLRNFATRSQVILPSPNSTSGIIISHS